MIMRQAWAQLFLCVLLANLGSASEKILFRADFEESEDLKELGWEIEATDEQSSWLVIDGSLEMTGFHAPYKGGRISHAVDVPERGVLDFDVKLDSKSEGNFNHFSLQIILNNCSTAFKKLGPVSWLRYRRGKNHWVQLASPVPAHEWVRFRMMYDAAARYAEFYCGNLEEPTYIDYEFEIEPGPGELIIGNYGLCTGAVTNQVDNISLQKWEEPELADSALRRRALIFLGPGAGHYNLEAALVRHFSEEQIAFYPMRTYGAATTPRNKLRLERQPPRHYLREAALVILADVPAGPGKCLPDHLLAGIEEQVGDGCGLLVLGGMFSFGKGFYGEAQLEPMLPVRLDGSWQVKQFAQPRRLREFKSNPAEVEEQDNSEEHVHASAPDKAALFPEVLWYHDLRSKEDDTAQVLLAAEDRPLVLSHQYNAGTVVAFLGMPYGNIETDPELWADFSSSLIEKTITTSAHRKTKKEQAE